MRVLGKMTRRRARENRFRGMGTNMKDSSKIT
jgi:hypothetical protein